MNCAHSTPSGAQEFKRNVGDVWHDMSTSGQVQNILTLASRVAMGTTRLALAPAIAPAYDSSMTAGLDVARHAMTSDIPLGVHIPTYMYSIQSTQAGRDGDCTTDRP